MSVNLATMLREGTKKSHTMAENVGFVKCFLRGVVDKNSYRELVANFYFVYSAMEEEIERLKENPIVKGIYFPLLHRKESLELDLCYYYGSNWHKEIAFSVAGKAYVERIREVAAYAPELLVAHSYTRYLGDLSGGQILKNIAQQAMNISNGAGTAFYDFEDIDDEKAFKHKYRQSLNELPIDLDTANRIVAEANYAFAMNMKMFQELNGNLIKAIGIVLYNSLTRRHSVGSTELVTAE